jgi:hypothetical protein
MADLILCQSRADAERYTALANANPVSGRPTVYDRHTKTYVGTFSSTLDAANVARLLNADWMQAKAATKRLAERSSLEADTALGIAWWNGMTKQARLAALRSVEPEGRASASEAWQYWKATTAGFKCEEVTHV